MKQKLLNPFNIGLIIIILVTIYTYLIRFYIPELPELVINITPTNYNSEMQQIEFKVNDMANDYYILIYEENPEQNWTYFNSDNYHNSDIASYFLPDKIDKYVLFKSNTNSNTYSFDVRPKYTINYMSNIESIFHVQLIIPYQPLFLPTFYYTTHYVFFLEPLI